MSEQGLWAYLSTFDSAAADVCPLCGCELRPDCSNCNDMHNIPDDDGPETLILTPDADAAGAR